VGGGVSIEAMNHVWKSTPYSPALSYILMAIADVVNDTHGNTFYMSIPNLAIKANCSERTIQRSLRQFEEDGWLTLTAQGNGRDSAHYQFNFVVNFPKVTNCPKVTESAPKVTNRVSIPISYTKNPITQTSNQFQEFWDIYPRKVGKAQAHKAFPKALKKIPFQDLLAGVKSLASDPKLDLTFCPHPASWLNGERWEDVREQVKIKVTHLPPRYDPLELDNPKAVPMPESVRKLLGSAFSGGLGVGEG
jgi:hypothetical protein